MILILSIVALVIIAIVAILITPIILCIDTEKDLYYFEFKGLFKMYIEINKAEIIQIRVRSLFRNFYFYPLRQKAGTSPNRKNRPAKRSRFFKPKMVSRLLKSFSIDDHYITIDTGNCITNARLYPLFAFLDNTYGGFNINFNGANHLLLRLKNRPIHLLTAFINI